MKELLNRVFVVETKEVIKKLGLPDGEIAHIELAGDMIQISLVGEKQ